MSQLNIEGATYGFDEEGSKQALENINEQIIEKVIQKMKDSVDGLMDKIDAAWVGPSAEIFKDNLFEDFSTIEFGMESARVKLYAKFKHTQQDMFDADTGILNKRRGEY